MFMNVGYTPPPPVWPPKKTTNGLGLYLPQNFVTPQRLIAPLQSAQIQIPSGWGMGCAGDTNCSCGCSGKTVGMGQLFESGTDISGWGTPEWSIVGIAAAAAFSLLNNVSNAGKSIRKAVRRRRKST